MQNVYLIGGRLNSSIYVEFIVFRAVAELKPFSFPNSFQRTDSLQFIISCLDRKIVIDFCFLTTNATTRRQQHLVGFRNDLIDTPGVRTAQPPYSSVDELMRLCTEVI